MIYFTADTHFGHKNIMKYCNRKFMSIESMNDMLVTNWNLVVKDGDTVYHLGDFAWYKDTAREMTGRLNGNIHLIRGNHDKRMLKGDIASRFTWVKDYYELKIEDDEMDLDQHIILSHFPFEIWNKRHHGAWHLHGHCHGTFPSPDHQARLDVGVDVHNYRPISYEEVKFLMTKKVFKAIDAHKPRIK